MDIKKAIFVSFIWGILGIANAQRIPDSSVTGTARATVGIDPTLVECLKTGNNCSGWQVGSGSGTGTGLGKRIGTFTWRTAGGNGTDYWWGWVNARLCITSASAGGLAIVPIRQNADGSLLWRINSATDTFVYEPTNTVHQPTSTTKNGYYLSAICYFDGPQGTFNMSLFDKDDNNEMITESFVYSTTTKIIYDTVNTYRYLGGRDKSCVYLGSSQRARSVPATYHIHRKSNHLDPITGVFSVIEYDTQETTNNPPSQVITDSDCPTGGL
ncbi:hypothetical protein RQP54_18460 [Curvibacter sp. APW13]|uniref:hypothetical protein n=1 Tax=Curvibacter sp. APW13 TaxID=3077236 RepID=UPI0028E01CC4|nr:hypothetical protein [Curvibacter sp. APW13]MDT8992863.1 hypothetical protein [Curvibacter sp. APW13]